MIARLCLLLLVLASSACRQLLDIPSDVSGPDGGGDGVSDDGGSDDGTPDDGASDDGDDDGTAADAGPGADGGDTDASTPTCKGDIATSIGFEDPGELDNWQVDIRFGCELTVENSVMRMRQVEPPGVCRALRELEMDLLDYGLQVNLADPGNDQMSMVYSVVLDDGNPDIFQRRRLRIERDDGLIKLGECIEESCTTDAFGSFPYDPANHQWWRIAHDAQTDTIHFEFASDNEVFSEPSGALPAPGVPDEQVRCVGAELGTYESTITDAGTAAFDFLIAGGGS